MFITDPLRPRRVTITTVFEDGIELNWLPPTEPNGEVHYVIYYTPEGGTEQSIDTGSDLTHYNLTGLERNRVYTNIAVQAVNSVGSSERSVEIGQYNHTLLNEGTHLQTVHTYVCMYTQCRHTVLMKTNSVYITLYFRTWYSYNNREEYDYSIDTTKWRYESNINAYYTTVYRRKEAIRLTNNTNNPLLQKSQIF